MASTSPRKSLALCTKCLNLVDKLKKLSCLHTFCKDCIKTWAQEHLNSSVKCPYCSKITFLPIGGAKALPDHFHVKILPDKGKVETEVKKPAKPVPKKPKDMKQIQKEWDDYFKQMKEELLAAGDIFNPPKVAEIEKEDSNVKDLRKIQTDLDRMCAQTAIQRALVAGDIIKANIAISKGESPPDVEVTEECFQQLLAIHEQKVEQVDFAIEHTMETKRRFEENMTKLRKDLREEADELIGRFVKQVEGNLTKKKEKLMEYEKESKGKIKSQLTQLVQQKRHIERVLEWAPLAETEENRQVAYSAMLVSQVRMAKASLSDRRLCNMRIEKAPSYDLLPGSLSLGYSTVGSSTWSLTRQIGKGRVKSSVGIAVSSDGDVAVTDMDKSVVRVFRKDGFLKAEFTVTLGRIFRNKMLPSSITIGPDGQFIVAENSQYIKVYNSQGKCQYQFTAMSPNNKPSDKEETKLGSLAVDNQGNLLVGELKQGYISTMSHDSSTQNKVRHLCSIDTGIEPHFLAVNSHNHIIVSDYKTASLLTNSGEFICDLSPPVYVIQWSPSGVCFTHDDEIMVANGNETKDAGIFHYSASGVYLGCITRDVICPLGIALTDSDKKLVVADSYNIKVFYLD